MSIIESPAPDTATDDRPTTSDKVLVGLTHGADDTESVLIAFLMGVEALRAGKQAVLWLTKDAVDVATKGFVDGIGVDGAPSTADLLDEFVERGGTMFACPVCIKLRGIDVNTLIDAAEVKGAPSVYEFAEGGALVFNY